jgi:hypothetical protein
MIYTKNPQNFVGAKYYRHHLCILMRLSNGNVIAQSPQRSHNLSARAKRVKHLRTEIFCEEFEYCGANALPLKVIGVDERNLMQLSLPPNNSKSLYPQ